MAIIALEEKQAARRQAFYCVEQADRFAAAAIVAEYHAQNETPAQKARRRRMDWLLDQRQ